MAKKSKALGLVIIGLLAAGGIFAYMKMRKKQGQPIQDFDTANQLAQQNESVNTKVQKTTQKAVQGVQKVASSVESAINSALSATPVIGGIFGAASPYSRKTVTTQSTDLNVREQPDATSNVIGKVAKGAVILVRPSVVQGWYDYSEDGKTTSGYVSMNYVK